MPPKGKLKDAEIAALTRWVKDGAVWPEAGRRDRPAAAGESPTLGRKITAEDRAFWSFRPIVNTPPPAGPGFDLAEVAARPLHPRRSSKRRGCGRSRPADKRTLIRRATFDLIGLPPTVEEVEAFVADESPEAFARVVDRLLASPHYGERWGRHWLDVARYGEDQAHTFQARLYPERLSLSRLGRQGAQRRHALRPVRHRADRRRPARRAGPRRAARGARLLRPRPGLLRQGGIRRAGRPRRHPQPGLPRPDRRLRPLPRPQVRPDPARRTITPWPGSSRAPNTRNIPHAPAEVDRRGTSKAQATIKAKTAEIAAYLKAESDALGRGARRPRSARYMVGAWTLTNRRKAKPGLYRRPSSPRREQARAIRPRPLGQVPLPEGRGQAALPRPLAEAGRRLRTRHVDLSADEAARPRLSRRPKPSRRTSRRL